MTMRKSTIGLMIAALSMFPLSAVYMVKTMEAINFLSGLAVAMFILGVVLFVLARRKETKKVKVDGFDGN